MASTWWDSMKRSPGWPRTTSGRRRRSSCTSFGGLSYEEVAAATGVSPATVDRDLRFAKAWLHRELQDKPLGS
jgi:hypothetical protein